MTKNYYEILKINKNATPAEIKEKEIKIRWWHYQLNAELLWFTFHSEGVYSDKYLDSNLWLPYSSWHEKMFRMPYDSNNPIELHKFRDEMIKAIKEAGYKKVTSKIEQARKKAINAIEEELETNNLTVEELNKRYQKYEEEINNLDKVWKVHSLRDSVKEHIFEVNRKKEKGSIKEIPVPENKFYHQEEQQPIIPSKSWRRR